MLEKLFKTKVMFVLENNANFCFFHTEDWREVFSDKHKRISLSAGVRFCVDGFHYEILGFSYGVVPSIPCVNKDTNNVGNTNDLMLELIINCKRIIESDIL